MTPKDLTTLKAALKILKKGHKPCKDFRLSCAGCQRTALHGLLEDEIEFYYWINKGGLKKTMTDPNDLLNAHFEEQRIHDLKIDIDNVLEEIERMHKIDSDNRFEILYKDLKWFKTLL